jgi:hypothetical protein
MRFWVGLTHRDARAEAHGHIPSYCNTPAWKFVLQWRLGVSLSVHHLCGSTETGLYYRMNDWSKKGILASKIAYVFQSVHETILDLGQQP